MPPTRSNIAFSVNDSELREFDRRLARVGKAIDKPTTKRIMRVALKPTLAAVRRNASVGPTRTYQSTARTRGSRKGTPRPSYESRRGGFTRKDARILVVDGQGEEQVRGLVGISKKGDKSGYRTHLITRANLHNHNPNDFLDKSERETETDVQAGFGQGAQEVVEKIILKNQ